MSAAPSFLEQSLVYLKGVGPTRAELFQKELGFTQVGDLIYQYPFRYVDKTKFHRIAELTPDSGEVQLKGVLRRVELAGQGRKKRLSGVLRDASGRLDLVWFSSVHYLQKSLVVGKEYVIYGRVSEFGGRLNMAHPEMEEAAVHNQKEALTFAPVYPSTEKLNSKGLDMKARRRLMRLVLDRLTPEDVPEMIPAYVRQKLKLIDRYTALRDIHFPADQAALDAARRRLKFEELFLLQLRMLRRKRKRQGAVKGHVFAEIGPIFNRFYAEKLPFELTGAQKRVLREIRHDLGRGVQMNRLLQGDVGSGKTMVGLMSMLMALDNGYQACLMAPTEILAQQHYNAITEYLEGMDIAVAFLSGSIKGKARKEILAGLADGSIHICIGTHALIEPTVVFQNLGLAITDEQHRFVVKQRARLWKKSEPCPPHVLVMTATPIPRTLAMTLYGDLDVSVIDELPPGRKPVKTVHYTEHYRERVFGFMREQIGLGRQVYVVYPLIEENEALDLTALEQGHEALSRVFPLPQYQISVVHGKMKPDVKEYEMQRFKRGETHIMVATTVIEVGVNVPNASVMVIEHTERFGLSQLHQLRGRVGRGADQSFCILMSGPQIGYVSRQRIKVMTSTNDGFKIAEADLKLRGPGNIEGTEQSGILNLRIADLSQDGKVVKVAREIANRILDDDPPLQRPEHAGLRYHLKTFTNAERGWARIS